MAGPVDGTPVVCHHGTPGSRLFAHLLADAAHDADARLLVPDRPGYGRSTVPPADWTWADWHDDVAELLAAESVETAPAVGFSGGGPFALATARGDWTPRVALVGAVVPPTDTLLTRLAKVPLAIRTLFGLSKALASVTGPGLVVSQYTDREVPAETAAAVAADFREALTQGASAVARENRTFAEESVLDGDAPADLRAWHGTDDRNASLAEVESFADEHDATLETPPGDHLGTLLDCRGAVLSWAVSE